MVVPLHLASVAPPAIAGSIGELHERPISVRVPRSRLVLTGAAPFAGILTQISINVGIFAAQAFSGVSSSINARAERTKRLKLIQSDEQCHFRNR